MNRSRNFGEANARHYERMPGRKERGEIERGKKGGLRDTVKDTRGIINAAVQKSVARHDDRFADRVNAVRSTERAVVPRGLNRQRGSADRTVVAGLAAAAILGTGCSSLSGVWDKITGKKTETTVESKPAEPTPAPGETSAYKPVEEPPKPKPAHTTTPPTPASTEALKPAAPKPAEAAPKDPKDMTIGQLLEQAKAQKAAYNIQLEAANALVERLEAADGQNKKDLETARGTLEAKKRDVETAQATVRAKKSDVETAQATVAAKRSDVETAQATVEAKKKELEQLVLGINRTALIKAQKILDEQKKKAKGVEDGIQSMISVGCIPEATVRTQLASQIKEAEEGVKTADEGVRLAQGEVTKAEAVVKAAQGEATKAEAVVKAAQGEVTKAEAVVKAAQGEVTKAAAGVKKAEEAFEAAKGVVQGIERARIPEGEKSLERATADRTTALRRSNRAAERVNNLEYLVGVNDDEKKD